MLCLKVWVLLVHHFISESVSNYPFKTSTNLMGEAKSTTVLGFISFFPGFFAHLR